MQTTPYFIGISLPPDIQAEVERAQRELFDTLDVIQPIVPHITLLHPPAVERMEPDELTTRIREITSNLLPFSVTLEGFGTFDRRSVHLRVQQQPPLMELHRKLVELLPLESQQTHYPDGSAYTPHVTLVQAKRGGTLPTNLLAAYTAQLERFLPCTFEVKDITLYRWIAPRQYRLEKI